MTITKSTLNEHEAESEPTYGDFYPNDYKRQEEVDINDKEEWAPEDICFLDSPSSN